MAPFAGKNCFSEMVWYFIGVYIINRTLHGRLEIRNFSSSVEKYFTSERSEPAIYYLGLPHSLSHSEKKYFSPWRTVPCLISGCPDHSRREQSCAGAFGNVGRVRLEKVLVLKKCLVCLYE